LIHTAPDASYNKTIEDL
jgi:hypothetical protein